MVKAYLIFVLLAMTAIIIASRWLPWWAGLILIPGSFFFFVWLAIALIKFGARRLLQSSLEDQSIVLRGATVTVHGVAPCQAPVDTNAFDNNEDEDIDLSVLGDRFVCVEMTVHPDAASVADSRERVEDGGGRWCPVLFSLMEPGVVLDPKSQGVMAVFSIPQARAVHAERVGEAGTTSEDDDLQIEGPARVRVTFAVPEGVAGRVAVRYHLLELAEITLPTFSAPRIEGETDFDETNADETGAS